VLANLLSHPKTTRSNVALAFKAYDEIRRPRAQRMQNTSYEAVQVYEFASPDGDDAEKLAETLAHRMDWIWKFDIKKQLQNAEEAFEKSLAA